MATPEDTRETIDFLLGEAERLTVENKQLRAEKAELLAVCKRTLADCKGDLPWMITNDILTVVKAAIAKAEGKT